MLSKIRIENFKSWQSLDMKLAPITALFGSNSSGKSSIIQFLLMLKQTKDSTNTQASVEFGGNNSLAELGSYKDAVYKHDTSLNMSWDLTWTADPAIRFVNLAGKTRTRFLARKVKISLEIAALKRQVSIERMSYTAGSASFSIEKRSGKSGYQLQSSDEERMKFVRSMGRPWDLPEPTKCYSFPDQVQTYFQNTYFLGFLENSYVNQMDQILHLGPLRDDPRRQYTWAGSSPSDVGRRGERTIEAILAATEANVRRNIRYRSPKKSFQEMIAWWLKQLGLIADFRVEEVGTESGLFRVFVKKSESSVETLITDVGFGVSQIIPVITLLYYAKEGSTVLIEQPEIHLHPSVQAGLADLFIAAAKGRNLQIIVESHSEHFLNRLLRRVAEEKTPYGNINVDDVALYFCENEDGRSKITPLELNLFGGITNWPQDFFGDQFEDIIAREKAASIKRNKKDA
ncbi:MAG: DUF3696 domain-containing protein [Novosphingobium sp.]|nr:DUF3696 domain-containing protein [Novosphingobium sp.]